MVARLLVLTLVLLSASVVSAQSPPISAAVRVRAQASFDEGTTAFHEARWTDCARAFEESFLLLFAPELLFNVGLCYQRAAESLPDSEARPLLERSLSAYQRYLREIPQASDRDSVRIIVSDLRSRVSRMAATEEAVSEAPPSPPTLPPVPSAEGVPVPVEETAPPIEEAPVFQVSRGEFPFTLSSGILSAVSLAVGIGLGVYAQDLYSNLTLTCSQAGCPEDRIQEVSSFATGANVMFTLSGLSLTGAGVAFGFEFTATESRTSASLSVSGRF